MNKCMLLLTLLLPISFLYAQKLVDTGGRGYGQTSVNTAIFRTNSLVSHQNSQYIAFYDEEGYMVLGKRLLGSDNWTLCVTQHRGNVEDAHNVISIMVDGKGYLHVAFDHHDNPLHYCRSVRPGSLILEKPEPMIGQDEERVTYPGFYRLPDGDLLFVYRSGASGRGNLVLNRYETRSRRWHRLPITANNAEYAWQIPQGSELINQTSMSADRKGNPYIAGYWRDQGSDIPQYRLVWFDGNSWQQQQVAERKIPFSLSGGGTRMIPISRPQLAIGEQGDRNIIYYLFRDEERHSRVSLAKKNIGTKSDWEVIDLAGFTVDAWEPSFDTELWKEKQKLHIYVQRSSQGDGEKSTDLEPQPVYVLEVE